MFGRYSSKIFAPSAPTYDYIIIIDLINNLDAPTDVIRHDIVCTFNDLRAYFDVKNAPQARKFSFLGAKTSIFKVINVLYTPKLRENRRKSAPKARFLLLGFGSLTNKPPLVLEDFLTRGGFFVGYPLIASL